MYNRCSWCECIHVHVTVGAHVYVCTCVCTCMRVPGYTCDVCMSVCMHVLHQKMSLPSSCFMRGCTSSHIITLLQHPGEWMNEPTGKQRRQLLNKFKTTYRKHSAARKCQEGYLFGIFQTTEGLFLKVLHGCLNSEWSEPPMPLARLPGKPKPPSLLLILISRGQDTRYWAC